ncbi:hypothetical protein BJX61DRAFT_553270 [Aspergillus egyptiacus]|nr:hypothetical protein BJX61DRAFT_553270 [Aspergillus egyptiacus]
MRYENWDVLLFPAGSKTPIQEFKTQCFVTRDRDSPYLHNPTFVAPAAFCASHGNLGKLPVLTTFVPSLPQNSAFRVSIHSWEQPHTSPFMENLLQPDDISLFEVRIFVDGLCVAGSVFGQRTTWPHVIDLITVIDIDKSGNQDLLRFPPFHREILEQRHWDAGDLHGRIRVVIAEGFARPHRTPPFERVREIIAFAFQHAPIDVLEYSSIAWPNASMWNKEPRLFKYNTGSGMSDLKEPDDNHAHSPARHNTRPLMANAEQIHNPSMFHLWRTRNYQGPIPQWQSNYGEPRWAPPEAVFVDPFVDPYVIDPARHRGARPSWEDVSMPDYSSSSSSSRAISNMTGISYEHSKHPSVVAPIDEESLSQLRQALTSPPKPLSCDAQGQDMASTAAAPPMGSKLSAAAEARFASYGKGGSRAAQNARKEPSSSATRDVSGPGAKSTAEPPDAAVEWGGVTKLHPSPSGAVKSRKEGLSVGNKENEVETAYKESDEVHQTPPKLNVRTSGSIETPPESKRRSSVGSDHENCLKVNRKEPPVLLSPTQDLPGLEDDVHQADFDCFLDPRPTLGSAATESGEIE